MDRMLLIAASMATIGVLAMVGLAYATQPPLRSLHDLARFEGQRVCVEGRIVQWRLFDGGGARFTLSDGNATLAGRSDVPLATRAGDTIRACGGLQRWKGVLELRIETARDLQVLRSWKEATASIDAIAQTPWDYVGQDLRVQGVLRSEGRLLYLHDIDGTGQLRASAPDSAPRDRAQRFHITVEYDAEANAFRARIQGWDPA